MDYRNRWTHTLYIKGVAYAPGDLIPATADPAQLAYFAREGIVEPTTAPAPAPPLRRVASPLTPKPSAQEVAPHGDDDCAVPRSAT